MLRSCCGGVALVLDLLLLAYWFCGSLELVLRCLCCCCVAHVVNLVLLLCFDVESFLC